MTPDLHSATGGVFLQVNGFISTQYDVKKVYLVCILA